MTINTGVAANVKTSSAGRIDLRLVQEQQKAQADRLKAKTLRDSELAKRIQETRGAMADAVAIRDIDRMKILNATFKEANEEAEKNRGDISSVMSSLLGGYKDIGVALKAAEDFTAEEQKLIDDAKKIVDETKDKVLAAKGDWYVIPGSRERTVAKANADVAIAEEGVKTATQMAEGQRRERRNNMPMQQSMQLQQAITQELTTIAQDRIGSIESNLTEIQANTDATGDALKVHTQELEKHDEELKQANAQLATLENDELVSYSQNSSEWQECRDRIRKKARERDDIESVRNSTFLSIEQEQVFIESSRMAEDGQRELLSQHKNWITLLQMGVQQREIQYQKYIDLLKDSADEEAMSRVDEVASEVDERVAENTAMIVQSMRQNTKNWMERAPKRLANMREIVGTNVEGQTKFEKEFMQRIDEFKQSLKAGYDDRTTYRENPPATTQ